MGVKDIKKAAKGELLHQSLYMYTECGGTTPKRGVVMCAPPAHTHKTHGKKSMIFLFLFFYFKHVPPAFAFFAVPWYEMSFAVCPGAFRCFSTNNKNQEPSNSTISFVNVPIDGVFF